MMKTFCILTPVVAKTCARDKTRELNTHTRQVQEKLGKSEDGLGTVHASVLVAILYY